MALTADLNRGERSQGALVEMPVAAGAKIYKNALLIINAAGVVKPAVGEAGAVYAGMAFEAGDNTNGAAAEIGVRVERLNPIEIDGTGFAQVDLGKKVYASDDNTVSTNTPVSDEVEVGIIIKVISATRVLVAQNTAIGK